MKKNKNKLLFLIMFTIIILLVFISSLFGSIINSFYKYETEISDKNNNSIDEYKSYYTKVSMDLDKLSIKQEKNNEITNNIEVLKTYVNQSDNYRLYLLLKNNNDYAIELKGTLNFYNKTGNRIDQNSNTISVVYPNTEVILPVSLSIESDDYYSYEFTYLANKVKSYYEVVNLKTEDLNITKTSSEILAIYNNKTGKDIYNIGLTCIYYKEGKIVAIKEGNISQLKNNESGSASFYNSLIKEEYDDYKIIISYGYIYNNNW